MSWLETYLEFTNRQESPTVFHLWSAIAVLGHALGRRVWLDRYEAGTLYPGQIMVVLVSGSAVTRKTTAMNLAAKFLRYLPEDKVYIVPNMTSTERFIRGLDRIGKEGNKLDAFGLILNDELGTFLSRSIYAETLMSHINQLNTNQEPIMRIEFQSWQAELQNALVGMLAATTHSGFADELPAAALKGGFIGRLIQVVADEPKGANPLTEPPPDQDRLMMKLLRGIQRISNMEGEFTFTPSGKEWFNRWYGEHFEWCWKHLSASERQSGWMGRKHDHLLRVAMVLSASATSDRQLDSRHLQAALMMPGGLEAIQPNIEKAMKEVGVREDYSKVGVRLIQILENKYPKWVKWKELLQHLHRYGNKDIIGREVQMLVEMEVVEQSHGEQGGRLYRKKLTRGEMLRRVKEPPPDEAVG